MKKIILITGATSGIGRATAHILGKNKDYQLIITGRRIERLETVSQEIVQGGGNKPVLLCFDVRDAESCKQQISSLPEEVRAIDVLVNNAGLAKGSGEIQEGNIENWDTMIDTNIKGLLYVTRAVTPGMVERKAGHIINLCSIAGKEVYPRGNVYNATKFAVDALTKAMRMDLYNYNIKVSSVSPGAVEETEFAIVRYDGDKEKASIYNDYTPLKARDIAEIIEFVITRPIHVNINDVTVTATQQASALLTNKSGRIFG